MRYEYRLQDGSAIYTGASSISFSLKATSNIVLQQVKLFSVKSSYVVEEDVKEITLQCNIGGGTATVESRSEDLSFSCNQTYGIAQDIQITVSIVGNGTFEISSGVDGSTSSAGGEAGILNTSTRNIPHFEIVYDILDESFLHDGITNDGYFYLNGLATEYGDYKPKPDWYIDESKEINEGYMFIEGLLTEYGDYHAKPKKLLIYKNNIRLDAYKDGTLLVLHKEV